MLNDKDWQLLEETARERFDEIYPDKNTKDKFNNGISVIASKAVIITLREYQKIEAENQRLQQQNP